MLVATQYESIESIESKIHEYVKEQFDNQNYELELISDYKLEDSRLALSKSVQSIDLDFSNASLSTTELSLSDCVLSRIQTNILDLIPVDLREIFTYEKQVKDSDRI